MIVVVARIETFSDISETEKRTLIELKQKYNLPPVLHRTIAVISNDLTHGRYHLLTIVTTQSKQNVS